MEHITYEDFEKLEIRAGTIISTEDFPGARKPSYKLTIDFGDKGIMKSSAQLTKIYSKDQLVGMQIIAVVNFAPKQIANFFSECLVLGVNNKEGQVVLLSPGEKVPDGNQVY